MAVSLSPVLLRSKLLFAPTMISQGPSGTSGRLSFTKFEIATNTAGVPLISTAKRYTRDSGLRPETGWILFFAHGTGFSELLSQDIAQTCSNQYRQIKSFGNLL